MFETYANLMYAIIYTSAAVISIVAAAFISICVGHSITELLEKWKS
jgi:hypothetical protein